MFDPLGVGGATVKLLVATGRTQGARPNDFTFAIDGELVYAGLICARDRYDPDGGCGCGRAFSGLASERATTTAEVRDVEGTRVDLLRAFGDGLERQGWGRDVAVDVLNDVLDITSRLPVGTVVERRLTRIRPRRATATH
jgi:hypothetical protein